MTKSFQQENENSSRPPLTVLALVGAGVLAGVASALLFPIALMGFAQPAFRLVWWLHILLQLGALLLAVCSLWRLARASTPWSFCYLGLMLIVLAYTAVEAHTPITARDALIYHLAVPKLWLSHGSIVELSWHEWSYFPLLTSLGYLGLLLYGWEALTPFYHLSFLVLTAALSASFVYHYKRNASLGLLAALFCLSLPLSMKLAAQPMADHSAAFYFAGTVFVLILWLEQPEHRPLALLAGVLSGLALSTKYSATLGVVVLSALLFWCALRRAIGVRTILSSLLIFSVAALVVYAPWPLRNSFWVGNPVHPFLGGLFGSYEGMPFFGKLTPIEYRFAAYQESLAEVLLLPLRMIFRGEDGNPQQFAGVLSPLVLLAFVPLVELRKKETDTPWLGFLLSLVVLYYIVSVLLFYALVRYQLLLLGVYAVLVACGVASVTERMPKGGARSMSLIIALAMGFVAAWYANGRLETTDALEYAGGSADKATYLGKHLSEYRSARWVNEQLPEDARVLLIFTGNRFYYYQREIRGSYFSAAPLLNVLSAEAYQSESAEGLSERLYRQLKQRGITHLAIHNRHTADVLNNALNDAQKKAWTFFQKNRLRHLGNVGSVSMWELLDGS